MGNDQMTWIGAWLFCWFAALVFFLAVIELKSTFRRTPLERLSRKLRKERKARAKADRREWRRFERMMARERRRGGW